MKLKLDENLGRRGLELLISAGHDVVSVVDQKLAGATDVDVLAACTAEGRCLVTLDTDFGNPLVFKPSAHAGLAVLRLPTNPTHELILEAVRTFAAALSTAKVTGKLWIVEPGRIREYEEPEAGDPSLP